jgi:hypothetical protein
LSPLARNVKVTAGIELNALSNVTVNITSAPLAKLSVDAKTGLTVGLNCISFAFSAVKLLFTELNKLVNQSHTGAYFYVQKDGKELIYE